MTILKSGDPSPQFTLSDQDNKTITLKQFSGSKILLYFYPKANTPGCTVQACSIRDNFSLLSDSGVICLGISPDDNKAQKKFSNDFGLPFSLLADINHQTADAFGVWGEKSMYGKKYFGIIRSAFLIDESGKIIQSWYKVKPEETVTNVLKILSEMSK